MKIVEVVITYKNGKYVVEVYEELQEDITESTWSKHSYSSLRTRSTYTSPNKVKKITLDLLERMEKEREI